MSDTMNREFGWEDTIENDSTWELLPEGDYEFEVKKFERQRHGGSEKMPACNKAVLNIEVTDGENKGTITHNLFLHTKTEGMLCAFFAGIGQRKPGEKLTMDWNKVVGSRGRCKVKVRDYTANNGEARQANQIQKFYAPDEVSAKKAYKAGSF